MASPRKPDSVDRAWAATSPSGDDGPLAPVGLVSSSPDRPAPPLAAVLAGARRRLAADARDGNGGTAAAERYAGRVDAILHRALQGAPPPECRVALAAMGGYGRRHLCLHSDIDLLVLFGAPIGPAEERFLHALLTPLWDLDITIGHQVRELSELSQLEFDNPEFLLALVDARLLGGDAALFSSFLEVFHAPSTHAALVGVLQQLIDVRHASFNDTIYQLEPDLKDSPGGLRDLTAIRTVASLTDPSLPARGPVGLEPLDEAEDFLLRIRSVLHTAAGRNQNRLTHDLQEKAAECLGYRGAQRGQRVERLMSDYFRHARAVARCLHWLRRSAPMPAGVNLGLTGGTVSFIDQRRAGREPESWLSLFRTALDRQGEVAEESLATIRQHVRRYPVERFFPCPAEGAAFVSFLRPRRGLYAMLTELHDSGLLCRLLPEFEAIAGRVTRDFYHRYTVDEHTLLTVRSLERLATAPGDDRFAALLTELEQPEWLVLALLLHDVGKWRDDDHATEGARMAAVASARLAVPDEAAETIDFLVRQHLRMARVAFRRDTEDPEVVKAFADLVGSEVRLKQLCLLTFADVSAVGIDTMTPWKADLLWRLYVDAYNHLTLEYADERIDPQQTGVAHLVADRPDDIAAGEVTRFVEGLPRRYLRLAAPEAVYRHIRLGRGIGSDDLHLSLERRDALWELTVVALDRPFLFSNVCGVLASFGLNICRGHAMTSASGLVLDIVQFTDRDRYLELNADGRERLFGVLGDAVAGRSDVAPRVERRERSVLRRRGPPLVKPVVHFDNQSSRRFTIVELNADDAEGLLYRVSGVMSRHGCDIDLVLIATEGATAVDVFHVTKEGAKLSDALQLALGADLLRALEATDEAGQGDREAEQDR